MEPKKNYYFTFMQSQPQKDNYIKIFDTYGQARRRMCDAFGDRWAFQYNEKDFLPQIERFGLTETFLEEQ